MSAMNPALLADGSVPFAETRESARWLTNLWHRFAFRTLKVADAITGTHDARWRVVQRVDKYDGDWTPEQIAAGEARGSYVGSVFKRGNLLMYGGASLMIQCLLGNGTSTAAQTLTFMSNARAALGVGDSTTAAAATQTDLQAASNKVRVAMDSTYPTHTDGTSSGAATFTLRSTFDTATANHRWREWASFNCVTAATGRMLNRKVEDLDGGSAKTSAQTWQLTVTITLS